LRDAKAGIQLNERIAENGPTIFAHACRLGAEDIVPKRVDGAYRSGPCRVWIKAKAFLGKENSRKPYTSHKSILPACALRVESQQHPSNFLS
jgi:hypothetical protein